MNRLLLLLGAAGLLLAAGCRKDDMLDCAPTTTSNLSLTEFTQRNGVAAQNFPLTFNRNEVITTSGGATLIFPANSFKYPTDSLAIGGGQVRIREIYSVADMLLTDMPTTLPRQGAMLVSGGEFNIQVRSGARRLRLLPGTNLTLQSPTPPNQDTTRQYVWKQPAAVLASDTAGWQWASAQRVQSLPNFYRALLPLDSIGWWNIDQLWHAYSTASLASVVVTTPTNPLTETRVYLRPVGFNGLARLAPTDGTGTRWTRAMPAGADMVVVVLQSVKGQLYYGTQRITVQPNLVINPVLTAVSESDAVRLIRQL